MSAQMIPLVCSHNRWMFLIPTRGVHGCPGKKYETQPNLGGPGYVVEVDECLIGHKMYRSWKAVEGGWVLGAIDRHTEEIRLEVCPKNKRDANTLVSLIKKHVHLGAWSWLAAGMVMHSSVKRT